VCRCDARPRVAVRRRSRASRPFYDRALAAIAAGGADAGAPGPRPEYTQPFYGAFVLDPDGFKVEAVCRQDHGSDARVAQ
jgi:hypothetical protein